MLRALSPSLTSLSGPRYVTTPLQPLWVSLHCSTLYLRNSQAGEGFTFWKDDHEGKRNPRGGVSGQKGTQPPQVPRERLEPCAWSCRAHEACSRWTHWDLGMHSLQRKQFRSLGGGPISNWASVWWHLPRQGALGTVQPDVVYLSYLKEKEKHICGI